MMRWISAAALWIFSCFANAATVENTYGGVTANSASPTISITAPGSGNAVIVTFSTTSAVTVTSVSDGAGYTNDFSSAADSRVRHFYSRFNVTDSPTTITINLSGSESVRYAVYEVSGLDSYDTGANGDTGGFTSTPSVSATSANPNAFAVAVFRGTSNRTWTDPASGDWTKVPGQVAAQDWFGYDADVGVAGSKTCDPTLDTGNNIYDSMAIYNSSSSSAVIPVLHHQLRNQ